MPPARLRGRSPALRLLVTTVSCDKRKVWPSSLSPPPSGWGTWRCGGVGADGLLAVVGAGADCGLEKGEDGSN